MTVRHNYIARLNSQSRRPCQDRSVVLFDQLDLAPSIDFERGKRGFSDVVVLGYVDVGGKDIDHAGFVEELNVDDGGVLGAMDPGDSRIGGCSKGGRWDNKAGNEDSASVDNEAIEE